MQKARTEIRSRFAFMGFIVEADMAVMADAGSRMSAPPKTFFKSLMASSVTVKFVTDRCCSAAIVKRRVMVALFPEKIRKIYVIGKDSTCLAKGLSCDKNEGLGHRFR